MDFTTQLCFMDYVDASRNLAFSFMTSLSRPVTINLFRKIHAKRLHILYTVERRQLRRRVVNNTKVFLIGGVTEVSRSVTDVSRSNVYLDRQG